MFPDTRWTLEPGRCRSGHTHPSPGLGLLHRVGGKGTSVLLDFQGNSVMKVGSEGAETRPQLRRPSASPPRVTAHRCCLRIFLRSNWAGGALRVGVQLPLLRPGTPCWLTGSSEESERLLQTTPQTARVDCARDADRCLETNLVWNQFHEAQIIKSGSD